ncbi:hypothetical protein [Jiangella gansuensis]|uniref:hypothetical protein n=1 Tax=Jiangella gansuensis TaxID=281473 RepID=UPI0004B8B69A|nr:hypothetical protein [Jiangella gansuensis]
MKRMLKRGIASVVLAGGLALGVAGAAAAYPGTDDGIFPPPEPPIIVDPGRPGPDVGIYPPPEPPIRMPL